MWKGKENGSRKGMNRNGVCIDILSLHQSPSCMYAAACLSLGCDMLFTEKAIGFHGEPGAGKTPVARTIAMAMSFARHRRLTSSEAKVVPSFAPTSLMMAPSVNNNSRKSKLSPMSATLKACQKKGGSCRVGQGSAQDLLRQ